jgi:pimeloyl-ACP methyl ester carboxylesterase
VRAMERVPVIESETMEPISASVSISPGEDGGGAMSDNGTFYTLKRGHTRGLVVCVHGIGSFSAQYEGLAAVLHSKGLSTLTYDLIGRGDSAYPKDNIFDGDAHVSQLRELILFLRLNEGERYHIIAHSMGGAIATLYAAQHLEEIQSLVLLAPAGLMDLGPIKLLRGCCSCFQGIAKNIIASGQEQAWRNDFVSHKGESLEIENAFVEKLYAANRKNPKMYDAFWESALQFPLSGIDAAVEVVSKCKELSVLVMWGMQDAAVKYEPNASRWRHLLLGDASTGEEQKKIISFVTYENMGHGFLLEHTNALNDDILSFFDNVKNK